MKPSYFALRHIPSQKLLGVETYTSNVLDDVAEIAYSLDDSSELPIWKAKNIYQVFYVLFGSEDETLNLPKLSKNIRYLVEIVAVYEFSENDLSLSIATTKNVPQNLNEAFGDMELFIKAYSYLQPSSELTFDENHYNFLLHQYKEDPENFGFCSLSFSKAFTVLEQEGKLNFDISKKDLLKLIFETKF